MENLCTLLGLAPVHALIKNGGIIYGNAVREALAGTPIVAYIGQAPVVASLSRRMQPILDRDLYGLALSSARREARADFVTVEYRVRSAEPRVDFTLLVHFISEFRVIADANQGTRADFDVNLVSVSRDGLRLRYLPPLLVSHPAPLTSVLQNIAQKRCVIVAEPRTDAEEEWLLDRRQSMRQRGWSTQGTSVELLPEAPGDDACPICLADEEDDSDAGWIRLRSCRHAFHQRCWLEHVRASIARQVLYPRVVACPLCRASVAYCDL